MEGARPRGRPKKTWSVAAEKDCQGQQLYKADATYHRKCRKSMKDITEVISTKQGVSK